MRSGLQGAGHCARENARLFSHKNRTASILIHGFESLNNVFRTSRRMFVAAIVEDTFYKCNSWFVERRKRAMDLVDANQPWSERVENKLRKWWEKVATLNLVPYSHGEGVYRVSSSNEYVPVTKGSDRSMDIFHREFKYIVSRGPGNKMECTCRDIKLTSISCIHVLVVCRARNWSEN